MSIAPHTDSQNVGLKAATSYPVKELGIKYATTNTPYGEEIAFFISFFLALSAVGIWGYGIYFTWQEGNVFTSDAEAVGYAAAGFVAIFISFFVVRFILLLILMPGNNIQPVPDEQDSIASVKATRITALGFISIFFYKLFGKKRELQQKRSAAPAQKKTTTSVEEIDELINTIE